MPKHPHAELMMQYAQDAMETETPWERWESKIESWFQLMDHPAWDSNSQYRRKPKTININGYEVPEPLRVAPKVGEIFYLVIPGYFTDAWANTDQDKRNLRNGIMHKTREAAELHAQALLSFTKEKE